ncbi:DUF4235 domain-containing protein [Xylanimonas oleitrophica]|uniref:DUF4235 domain-containing protein n=1 Tax=Xylanimonas oleitrophica TaxID=2607479 RepID=A0A2W5WWG5_9MICO|nr:DUF4235 domain-containing protein [Xylanimonas oleitrophica]PZR52175.1 DUF4235 domain-containing protein [Xylanimonas oleitrophica]
MANRDETLAVKVGTLVLTLAAGWAAQRLVGMVWEKSTGHVAPHDLDDDEISGVQAVTFAAVSGAVAVLARRLARQGALRAAGRYASKQLH